MKTFLLATLLSLFTLNSLEQQTTVYISTGSGAYAYHSRKSCSRLKKCNEEGHVRTVTMEKAISMGRTPCKVCCKSN